MFDFCRKRRVAKDDLSSEGDIPMSSSHGRNHIVWEMECIGSRLILYSELQSGIIYYNAELNVIESQDGYVLKGILPPLDVLNRYWQCYDTLEPPQVVIDKADGREYVLEQENVFFDANSKKYIHARISKVIYGYKPQK
jgi:hypothetical protein